MKKEKVIKPDEKWDQQINDRAEAVWEAYKAKHPELQFVDVEPGTEEE